MKKNILVATPQVAFGELIRLSLEENGNFQVRLVQSATEVMASASYNKFDLAILDAELSAKTFAALTKSILEVEPDLKLVVIPPDNDPERILLEGITFDGFLNQPFYLPDLLNLINKLTGDQQAVVPEPVSEEAPQEVKPLPEPPAWMTDVNRIAQLLAGSLLENSAHAAVIARAGQVISYAGQLTEPALKEMLVVLGRYWSNEEKTDLARYVRLDSNGGEYLLYATGLMDGLVLALIYDVTSPISRIRFQTNNLARILSSMPAPAAMAEPVAEAIQQAAPIMPPEEPIAAIEPEPHAQAEAAVPLEDTQPVHPAGINELEAVAVTELAPAASLENTESPVEVITTEESIEEESTISPSTDDFEPDMVPVFSDMPTLPSSFDLPELEIPLFIPNVPAQASAMEPQDLEERLAASIASPAGPSTETPDLEIPLAPMKEPLPPAPVSPQLPEPGILEHQLPAPLINSFTAVEPVPFEDDLEIEDAESELDEAYIQANLAILLANMPSPDPEARPSEVGMPMMPVSSSADATGDPAGDFTLPWEQPSANIPQISDEFPTGPNLASELPAQPQIAYSNPVLPPLFVPENRFSAPAQSQEIDDGLSNSTLQAVVPEIQSDSGWVRGDLDANQVIQEPLAPPSSAPVSPQQPVEVRRDPQEVMRNIQAAQVQPPQVSSEIDNLPRGSAKPQSETPGVLQDLDKFDQTFPGLSQLYYTCVLVPRMPKHFLTGEYGESLSQWLPELCLAYGWRLEALSVRPDHLNWSVNAQPSITPASIVRVVRQQTSERLFEHFPTLRAQNPGGDFWASGYLIASGCQSLSPDLIRDYIQQTRRRQGLLNP